MNQANTSFEKLFEMVVSEVIFKMLGAEVWKALRFYFDTKTAARDLEAFTKLLDKVFGASSKTHERMVIKTLCTKMGIPPDRMDKKEFAEGVSTAKARFSSYLTNLSSNP